MCSEENKNQQKHAKLTSELLEFMQSKINQNFSDKVQEFIVEYFLI